MREYEGWDYSADMESTNKPGYVTTKCGVTMKVYNKKLAKRIAECEQDLANLRSRVGEITSEVAETERLMQKQINADKQTLLAAGFDKRGKRIA